VIVAAGTNPPVDGRRRFVHGDERVTHPPCVRKAFTSSARPFRFQTTDAHPAFRRLIVHLDEMQLDEARRESGQYLMTVSTALNRQVVSTVKIGVVGKGEQINHGLSTFGIRNEHNSTSGRAFCKGSAKRCEQG
jgi:hypothetical protein